ncbi:MAG: hypothetical protein AAF211_13530, partial [Myxococcota bacterium]
MRFIVPVMFATVACSESTIGEGPLAPSDVRALPGNGFVRVLWQDNSDDETGFAIYRETVAPDAVDRSLVASVAPDVTEWDDLQVDPASTYRYAVAAVAGNASSDPVEMAGEPVAPLAGDLTDCTVGDATVDDQDADGVPDANELSGWTVTITDGLAIQTTR